MKERACRGDVCTKATLKTNGWKVIKIYLFNFIAMTFSDANKFSFNPERACN